MRNLERLLVETGQVIQRRYLLQRLIKQGTTCAVYQGFDQVLQRVVAIKVAAPEYQSVYRAALRMTAAFAHPNIIGFYDLIVEPEALYIVQEYVDGADFAELLQAYLTPSQVVELGMQLCQALLYASASSRKVCHGDLTPSAIIRDRHGMVRVNNFALPSDAYYFASWNVVGGSGEALSDPELAPGKLSDGRRSDDVRAVGLLLYQLLAGRSGDVTKIEPSPDGKLRFARNAPPEVCEVIARAVVRMHPQHFTTIESLYAELKTLAQSLEMTAPSLSDPGLPSVNEAAQMQHYSPAPTAPSSGRLVTALPVQESMADIELVSNLQTNKRVAAVEVQPVSMSGIPAGVGVSDMPMKLVEARRAAYTSQPRIAKETGEEPRLNIFLLLLIGLVLFAVFFGLGILLSHLIFP